MPTTPLEALGPSILEKVLLEDRVFVLEKPSDSDKAMRHPSARGRPELNGYVPYWADLWPASRMLAKWILRQSWPAGLHALEIGCGLGLPGLAALSVGMRVTFSDYDATALHFAAKNARRNGFRDFDTLQLDWRYPPTNVHYPLLLAADLLYESSSIEPLVGLIRQLLAKDGTCLLTDLERIPALLLRQQLDRAGLSYTTQLLRAGEPGGRREKGTLYQIKHPATEPV